MGGLPAALRNWSGRSSSRQHRFGRDDTCSIVWIFRTAATGILDLGTKVGDLLAGHVLIDFVLEHALDFSKDVLWELWDFLAAFHCAFAGLKFS